MGELAGRQAISVATTVAGQNATELLPVGGAEPPNSRRLVEAQVRIGKFQLRRSSGRSSLFGDPTGP